MAWINIKLYLRDPVATFFTLAFAPFLVLVFGAMFGNEPNPIFGGQGSMDISMPAYTALIVGTVGIMGVPITVGAWREQGVLRRYKATPLHPLTFITADIVTNLAMALFGTMLLVGFGFLLYQVKFEGNVLSVLAAVLLGGLAMLAFGYLIASLAPGARSAQVLSMLIFYPMMFLSGSGMPLEIMPDTVQRISNFLPMTYMVRLLRGLWFGASWGDHLLDAAVLLGLLLVCGGLAARFFRWE